MRKKQQAQKRRDLPEFCDFHCTHASFTEPETSGACRREVPVYCSLFKKLNTKHSPCLEKKR